MGGQRLLILIVFPATSAPFVGYQRYRQYFGESVLVV